MLASRLRARSGQQEIGLAAVTSTSNAAGRGRHAGCWDDHCLFAGTGYCGALVGIDLEPTKNGFVRIYVGTANLLNGAQDVILEDLLLIDSARGQRNLLHAVSIAVLPESVVC